MNYKMLFSIFVCNITGLATYASESPSPNIMRLESSGVESSSHAHQENRLTNKNSIFGECVSSSESLRSSVYGSARGNPNIEEKVSHGIGDDKQEDNFQSPVKNVTMPARNPQQNFLNDNKTYFRVINGDNSDKNTPLFFRSNDPSDRIEVLRECSLDILRGQARTDQVVRSLLGFHEQQNIAIQSLSQSMISQREEIADLKKHRDEDKQAMETMAMHIQRLLEHIKALEERDKSKK